MEVEGAPVQKTTETLEGLAVEVDPQVMVTGTVAPGPRGALVEVPLITDHNPTRLVAVVGRVQQAESLQPTM
jgi:hypothetical protein